MKKPLVEAELKLDPIDTKTYYRNLKDDYGGEDNSGDAKT